MRIQLFFMWSLICLVGQAMSALVAFDCRTEDINKTSISLVQLPECSGTLARPVIERRHVVITQTEQKRRIEVSRCLVTLRHLIFRCGQYSDTPRKIYSEVHHMPREDCARLISSNEMTLPGQNPSWHNFGSNPGIAKYSYQSFGSFEGSTFSSNCQGGQTLSIGSEKYEWANRITEIEVAYGFSTALLEVDTGRLAFPNGERCDHKSEYCQTASYGDVYWKREIPTCSSETSKVIVYKGLGEVVTTRGKQNRTEMFIQVQHENYDFQIKMELESKASICGFPSHHTEHPDLFVTLLDLNSPAFPNLNEVTAENVNLVSYINSKLVYALRHTKEQVEKLYDIFHQERCALQNRITQNLQTLALLSPREFAYQYFGKPGYTAVTRGEVIYAAQCKPVPVVPLPADTTTCFNEMVVTYENRTWYMSPRTRILIPEGTIIPCSAEFSPLYYLNGHWVSQNPLGLTSVRDPKIIQYEEPTFEFETMKNLVNGGLYTPEVLQAYQRILTSPMEEAVILSRMTESLRGEAKLPAGYSYARGLTEDDFQLIGNRVSWLSWFVSVFGSVGSWFGGYLLIKEVFNLLFKCVDTSTNFVYVAREKGIVVAVVVCLFNSISHLILSGKWNKKKSAREQPIEENQPMIDLPRPNLSA